MYIDREAVLRLKETPITHYLYSVGFEPVRSSGNELIYCSPLTGERTPSFYVNPTKNRFNCFSSGEKGDIIHLVSLLEKKPFKSALERLATIDQEQLINFSFSGQSIVASKTLNAEKSALNLVEARVLQNPVLIDYVINRGIPSKLAGKYLHEVRYKNYDREYYAIGFKTDKGSYALRSKAFKGWLGQSGISSIPVEGSTTINLFEGFFDFLSVLAFTNTTIPDTTTIVLNSTTNLKQVLPALKAVKMVNCFFDNDNAGRTSYSKLEAMNVPLNDCSNIYKDYNDFNDMIRQHAT